MSGRSLLWVALGTVLGLMILVIVIVLPAADDPCEGESVLGPSQTALPPLGGYAPGDPRSTGTSATPGTPGAAATSGSAGPTATLAAEAEPKGRTMPMGEGTYSVSDVFGSRGGEHKGVDMAAPDGTPIFSVSDGVVVAAGAASGFGNWIVVDSVDDNGRTYSAVYGHMYESGVLVGVGDQVRAGQHIAAVGSAGQSSGAHLHFEVVPGGRFTGGRQIDPMPWLDGAPTPDVGGAQAHSADPRCVGGFGTQGGTLADDKVPPELEMWYRRAGSLCPEISPSLLAAQGRQESGFRRGATSPAGAQGLAQFLPGTATSSSPIDGQPYVIDADGNGTASVWDDGDAIVGQGRYMCAIASKVSGWVADGRVQGDVVGLTLAAYNAGEGAVLESGGMPNQVAAHLSETQPYVDNILALEAEYRAPGALGRFTPEQEQDGEGAPGQQVVQAAHDWLGTPYVWGGGGPQGPTDGGLDGAGLTSAAVFAASAGELSLPRTAEQQWEIGTEVPISEMQPGDLVFSSFGPRGPATVGIHAGGGRMIWSAPSDGSNSGGGVAEAPVPGDARARRVQ